ncbi:MAG: hypothetical protein HY060_18960 [Proteobacteria bacterium]|nr:hypothetical protein [Pseudomonadota bacterium]
MRLRWAGLGLVALLAACGGGREAARLPPGPPVSPLGEPLISATPGTACDVALAQWFDRVDGNRDGMLDMAEFSAAAARWFALMDANGDGSVTPDELTTLRLKLVPPPPPPKRGSEEELAERRRERQGRGWFDGPARRGPNEQPDPVMSADVNLDNRVTLDEFQAQAARTFAALDRNRDGRLSKDEVAASCPRRS